MKSTLTHLNRLYASSDDPWNFAHSPYEQEKFEATRKALRRDAYDSALEIGCGNGVLAGYLAPLCKQYIGIDAVARAVEVASARVQGAAFVQGVYPCALPPGPHDLIILSEVLYFLSTEEIGQLGRDLMAVAPRAEVICVTYLGDTQMSLQGPQALEVLRLSLAETLTLATIVQTGLYRIDGGVMSGSDA